MERAQGEKSCVVAEAPGALSWCGLKACMATRQEEKKRGQHLLVQRLGDNSKWFHLNRMEELN